nr:hypothetical protein [Tanacetum cinerariifolium]
MIANPKSDLKAITTRSGVSYNGHQIPPTVVENEPKVTKNTVNPTNNGNTEDVQPQAVQFESPLLISKPVTSLISEPQLLRNYDPKGARFLIASRFPTPPLAYHDSLNAAACGNLLERSTQDVLTIIENKLKVRNSRNKSITSQVKACDTNSSSVIAKLTHAVNEQTSAMTTAMTAMLRQFQANPPSAQVKAVKETCVTCEGAHSYYQCLAAGGNIFLEFRDNIQEYASAAAANYNQDMVKNKLRNEMKTFIQTSLSNQTNEIRNMMASLLEMNTAYPSSSGTLPSNTIANPKSDLKEITTRNGVSYDVPLKSPPVVENAHEANKDTVIPTNNGNTEDVLPQAVSFKPLVSTSEPANTPVSASKPNTQASIPYPSRRNEERNREKAKDQIEKFYQIFKDMSFKISFTDALILMPKFASSLKALIGKKEKLNEMARTPLNEHCSAVLLKKLPKKLGDPGKFLIPCDFSGMAECLALADLELADRSISRPVGVAEDVYVKTGKALINVFEGELTLRVGKEAITFNLDQTSRYSANYNDMTAKIIDVIDMACEEYSQEVLGFSDTASSGNPTPLSDPIISATSSTLTPFRESDFLLEEVNAFLAVENESISSLPQSYLDPEGDILFLEAFLNDDPSSPSQNQRNSLPEEKAALITVLKSHKRSIAWKLSDIKGINPEFCSHKILLEKDFTPAIQHQRRVNPKIHDVIKQEVIKLLDAGLIYLIYDSSWVSPVHCVPKKGGFTIVENEENELIPTRLVTGWRICIDYRKLNDATRKDHFPLPFMDQMLERLAGISITVFLMVFLVTFKFPSIPRIEKRPLSPVHTGHSLIVACLLGYATLLERFKGV